MGNNVTVTTPDGQTNTMTVQQLLSDPELYKSVSDTKGYHSYNVPKSQEPSQVSEDKKSSQSLPTATSSLWIDRQQKIYKQAHLIPSFRKLEEAIGSALNQNIKGIIVNANDEINTTFEDIEKSVQLCVGYLINQGKISEAQAVVDALDVAYKEPLPSATTFVIPQDVTQTALFQPTESQQIGKSQIDPPKSPHHKSCDHCHYTVENIYLLDSDLCPNCKKVLKNN